LDKRTGESTESVSFRFTAGVAFAGSSDLSSAQVTGNLLDDRGSINLAFSPNGAPSAVPVPKGCTGTPGSLRRGTLTGSLILNADRLGTVTLTAADATLATPPGISECSGARSHRSQGTAIEGEASRGGEGAYVFAFKPSRSGSAREGVTLFRAGDGFSFSWSFSALVPRSDYTFTSDLAGGTLTGVRGFHGTARYVGSPAHGGASHGRIAGNLWADFASLGAVRPFARLHLHADQFHISKP
jgi:hypothetical protein